MLDHTDEHWSRRPSLSSLLVLLAILGLGTACGPLDAEDAEKEGGIPVAGFDQDETNGSPGLVVQFSDTSSGDISSYAWDFGALGTSSERNPSVQFDALGSYSVRLTVTGPSGVSSLLKEQLISVNPAAVVGFTCTPTQGFVPMAIACTDESIDVDSWLWSFGDGQTSTEQNPVHIFTGDGPFIVRLDASGPGGSGTHTQTINARTLGILASSSGAAPVDASFDPDTKGVPANQYQWEVDGQIVQIGSEARFNHRFKHPGTFKVKLTTLYLTIPPTIPPILGTQEIDFFVGYGSAMAAFTPSVSGGNGPLSVQFDDDSTGELSTWRWDFGDGSDCVYPAVPNPPMGTPPTCSSSSPAHTYGAVGSYDVQLTVTGPASNPSDPDVTSTHTETDAVRVYIVDPSFENQTANAPIGGGWQHLRPTDALTTADHLALTDNQGADGGMPSDGKKWAALDGLGTDGSTPVENIENGIRQVFMHPPGLPVLELDYMLLYAEPPASPTLDAVVATVSDGTTTLTIPSSVADPSTPYAGTSARYPSRDGGVVRATPRITASIDLASAFPASSGLTPFTLTIRTANAENERRSPRAYVDNVRFAAPVTALAVDFTVATNPIVAGSEAEFVDNSCPNVDTDGSCLDPVSWLWDFGTHGSPSPPPSTGSDEQSPMYSFDLPGDYDVTLIARLAEADGTATRTVTVLESPIADFVVVSPTTPYLAGDDLVFEDRSTTDPLDSIAAWSWDFGGWGTSSIQNPAPVRFPQTGSFLVTLTITTTSGFTSTHELTVTIE